MTSLIPNILKILIAYLSIVSIYSSDYVVCPDETSACPDGSICCLRISGDYSCCINTRNCCFDGTKCCDHKIIRNFLIEKNNYKNYKNDNNNKNTIIDSENSIKNPNLNRDLISASLSVFNNTISNLFENFSKKFEKFNKCLKKLNFLSIYFEFSDFINQIKKIEIRDFNIKEKNISENLIKIKSLFNSFSLDNLIEDKDKDCIEIKNEFIKYRNIIDNLLLDF
jgi:hypothetical protein